MLGFLWNETVATFCAAPLLLSNSLTDHQRNTTHNLTIDPQLVKFIKDPNNLRRRELTPPPIIFSIIIPSPFHLRSEFFFHRSPFSTVGPQLTIVEFRFLAVLL